MLLESVQRVKYNNTAKGRARRTKYRRDNSKWQTDASYLARPFLGWDGEGVTLPDGRHIYTLLANSGGAYIADPDGLPTWRCLRFLLDESAKHAGAINVAYGAGYDINMILGDLTRAELLQLYRSRYTRIRGYNMSWRRGKSLYVSDGESSIMLYDVAPFFQCAFIKAVDDYLGDRFYERDLIVKNKALRSSFTVDDIPEVMRYNAAELVNLVELMKELRSRLNKVGLRPARWDGPGAIAAALLRREHVKEAMNVTPPDVAEAARYAYAGGRFELVRYGSVGDGSSVVAYEYDINSAYPSALRHVPNLRRGHWERVPGDAGPQDFALYHIDYSDSSGEPWLPGPLFCRRIEGTVAFPMSLVGWYWSPEANMLRDFVALHPDRSFTVLETYVYVPDNPEDKPFEFIERLYAKRRALKAGGDGAHVGIKLGLNSLYGKLAQQVGWEPAQGDKPMRIPPFHQIEWAGYVTSYARAEIMRAAMTNLSAVIAFETDALFTSEPLPVKIGSDLGEWEATEFTQLTYVQSGTYFGTLADGSHVVAKTRGVDRGSLTHEHVLEGLANPVPTEQTATASLTRFVGAGIALVQSFDRWRRWETEPKVMKLYPSGKRDHIAMPSYCWYCTNGAEPLKLGVWHMTYCTLLHKTHSVEFPIEWINPNSEIPFDELRDSHYETGWGD